MRVLIDDQPCSTPCATVADAIEAAREATRSNRRVIVEVIVDGNPWNEELASDPHLKQSADEVRLISADQNDLLRQTLDAVGDAIDGTDASLRGSAEMLQSGMTAEGMQQLQQAVETIGAIQEAIAHIADLEGIDLEAMLRSGSAGDALQRMQHELEQVRAAIAAEDPIGLADLLLYEMPTVTTDLREVVATLRRRLETNGESR